MTSEAVIKLGEQNDKLEGRADYLRGNGYDVTLEVTYTRVRRVRALSEDQAREFATAREARYAPNYFHTQNHGGYSVESVKPVACTKAASKDVVDD